MDLEGKSKITELAVDLVKTKALASIEQYTKVKKQAIKTIVLSSIFGALSLIGGALCFSFQNLFASASLGPILGCILFVIAALLLACLIIGVLNLKGAKKEIEVAQKLLDDNSK
jgi:uncharacterized membrane protein (DUF373 family)